MTERVFNGGVLDTERFTLSGTDDGASASISELRTGFRQGFILEIFDPTAGTTIDGGVHVMVLNPVRYNLSEPFTLTLTPAEDNTVVSEENGIIVREITLEGTYGLSEKRARGFNGAQGGGNPMSGTDHFEALRSFFRLYSARKKDARTSANTVMIFHALRTDDHFIVKPRTFETPRDAQKTRVHYEFRITMAATDEATQTGLLVRNDTDPATILDQLSDGVRAINDAFNDGRAAIAEVTANLSEIRRKVGNINTILNNAIQFVNAVGGFVSGVTSLINYPLQLAANVAEGLATAADTLIDVIDGSVFGVLHENARSLRRIEAAIDRIMLFDDKFEAAVERVEDLFDGERRLTAADISSGTGGATVGSRVRVVAGSGRDSGLSVPRGTGLVGVVVQRTDTIESIATAAGTSPEAVIIINDLRPPYIAVSGGPGILAPGDIVLVPGATGGGSSVGRGSTDYLTSEEALYGIDAAIDLDYLRQKGKFELLVNETNNPLDLGLSRGINSVVQGTEITIATERGTTVFLPSLGIRRNVGTRGTIQHVLLASITLREAMLQDGRISGLASSRVALDSETGELTQEITPIVSGRRSGATFVLPFGRATGGGG